MNIPYTSNIPTLSKYKIGRYTYGIPKIIAYNKYSQTGSLTIGSFTSISTGVTILLGGNHRLDWVTTYPFGVFWKNYLGKYIPGPSAITKGDVIIGNDVWIGMNVTILSGVTIGNGVVIGAQSVISKDVPPYAIVVGNPGRVVRYRFDPATIKELLKISWWDWEEEKIKKYLPLLLNNNIQDFVEKFKI